MQQRKLRTAARLTSKPPTEFEQEQAGYQAGRADAFADRPRRRFHLPRDDHYADGYNRAYSGLVCNEMVGR